MFVKIQDTICEVANHVSDISLRKRIEYDQEFGDEIELAITDIEKKYPEKKDEEQKLNELSELYFERVQKTVAYFSGQSLEFIQQVPIGETVELYEKHFKSLILLNQEPYESRTFLINNEVFWLPKEELVPASGITFGQFISSKEVTRNLSNTSSEKLTSLAYLGAIFLKKEDQVFSESDIDFEGEIIQSILNFPITTVVQIGNWYDAFTKHIHDNFSVFKNKSKKKRGEIDLTPHFDKWGWISFLNYVAKNGTIFYKSNGISNLENVKNADLYEVLIWASCEKDLEHLITQHQEINERKNRNK